MRVFHYVMQPDGEGARVVAYAFYSNYALLHQVDSVFVPDCYRFKCRVLQVRVRENASGRVTMYVALSALAVRSKKATKKKFYLHRAS